VLDEELIGSAVEGFGDYVGREEEVAVGEHEKVADGGACGDIARMVHVEPLEIVELNDCETFWGKTTGDGCDVAGVVVVNDDAFSCGGCDLKKTREEVECVNGSVHAVREDA